MSTILSRIPVATAAILTTLLLGACGGSGSGDDASGSSTGLSSTGVVGLSGAAIPLAEEMYAPVEGLTVETSRTFLDRPAGEFFVDLTLFNGTDDAVTGPVRVVVSNNSDDVLNADGTDGDGNPFIVVSSEPDYVLGAGATSAPVRVRYPLDRGAPTADYVAEGLIQPLQLLHNADMDGAAGALENVRGFSAILEAFRALDPDNTLVLSSGDNYIPGPRFFGCDDDSLEPVIGAAGAGYCDMAFLNAMGYQASSTGNHEFDLGPGTFAEIISPDGSYPGAQFPYLATNLDFTTDSDTAPLVVDDGQEADSIPNSLAGTALVSIGGQTVGLVGAVTPNLAGITTLGAIEVSPEDWDESDLAALAEEIQEAVDSLTETGVNKVILLAHMQQISIEKGLAPLLNNVDIIIAGGSNTLLADGTDYIRPGDTVGDVYPLEFLSPENEPVLVVNTDGDYKYLGRLVLEFDANGIIDPASLDVNDNGAWASDETGVMNVEMALGLPDGSLDPNAEVDEIADALDAVLLEKDGNILGSTNVFLEGRRGLVRTEETNLGNLTADANLWQARQLDSSTVIALKNGGGIRAEIGRVTYPPGSTDPDDFILLPPAANPAVGKQEGDISQLALETALRFNNGLTLLSVTAAELHEIMEHAVSATAPGATPGQFPHVGGMRFSFDPSRPAREGGDEIGDYTEFGQRVRSLAIVAEDGSIADVVVQDGALVGDPGRTFRLVILDFIAKCVPPETDPECGDGYPLKGLTTPNRVDLETELAGAPGDFDFADPGSEQDAFAEYASDFFPRENPYNVAETPPELDQRIQNLSVRDDTVLAGFPRIGGVALNAAEIVAYDPLFRRAFVTGETDAEEPGVTVVDLSDPENPVEEEVIDFTTLGLGPIDGVTSVSVHDGVVAAAVAADPQTNPGTVVFLDTATLDVLGNATVGALPDMVTFSPDGSKVLVANEGEPDGGIDPEGSVSIIDVSGGFSSPPVAIADFTDFNGQEDALRAAGVRIFPGKSTSVDVEPEYIAVSPDGGTAFVTLQEANAVGVVDVATATVTDIVPLGLKDHSLAGNGLDGSNEDGAINIANWPVFGMYMPDSIASFEVGGNTYYLTANEGDARDEDADIGDLTLDATAFPNAATLQLPENIGNLEASSIDGDTDADGEYEQLYVYGARSFTIWNSAGALVFDSGDEIGQITAVETPTLFNANDGDPAEFDDRSDNKGAEPEAVIATALDGRSYAVVGLERAGGGVLIYDVTDPGAPVFVEYARDDLDIAPEGLAFISAADSPIGVPLLLISNEESSTVAVYQFVPQLP